MGRPSWAGGPPAPAPPTPPHPLHRSQQARRRRRLGWGASTLPRGGCAQLPRLPRVEPQPQPQPCPRRQPSSRLWPRRRRWAAAARAVPPSPRPSALPRRVSELTSTGTTTGDRCSTENDGRRIWMLDGKFQRPAGVDSNFWRALRLRKFWGSARSLYMAPISTGGWIDHRLYWAISTGGGQCQPLVEIVFYRRLALTTACRNSSIQAVVNANRLYKDFCNFFIIFVFYIFGNCLLIACWYYNIIIF